MQGPFPLDPGYAPAIVRDRRAATGLRLAMHQLTTYRWSLPEAAAGSRQAGFDGLGVWRQKLEEFGTRRGVKLLRDSGLAVSSVSWAGGFTGSQGLSFNEAVDDAREAVRLAAALNAPTVVIVGGGRAGHTVRHSRRLVAWGLRELADFAADHNVRLALQPMLPQLFHRWTFLGTIDETLDILHACRHPAVRMAFDVYHLWREPNLLERIPGLVPEVAHVQLSDWNRPPVSENDRCLPGEGVIPIHEIVQAFLAAGYEGWFDVQVWSERLWASPYRPTMENCRRYFQELPVG